jgi:hypothetical protein
LHPKEHENIIIFKFSDVFPSSYGFIYNITFGVGQNKKSYQVIIGDYPSFNCLDFVTMMASLLRGQGKWV